MTAQQIRKNLPITVIVAVKNEAANIDTCLNALSRAERVILVDSRSADLTANIALEQGAEVVQFVYEGGYPKKRQWAMDNIEITSPWTMLIDADEVVTPRVWDEVEAEIYSFGARDAYLIEKGFHFLGRPLKWGGFSHSAVLLFRTGKARFERLFDDVVGGLDMEVHERVLVEGSIGRIRSPIVHQDFKGLQKYIDRHNEYSSWEAMLRMSAHAAGRYGVDAVRARIWGNSQERRRALKRVVMQMPFEPVIWFCYHYFFRLGFLEGRRGLIVCVIRAWYIFMTRAKMYERRVMQ